MAAKVKPQEEAVSTVSVVVVHPFQVSHEATVFGPGEGASVPAEVAAAWVANGWAEPGTAAAVAPESTGFRAPRTK